MTFILISSGLLIYSLTAFATIKWMLVRRKTRWPFKDSDKLLRSPGETLKRQYSSLGETIIETLLFGMATVAVTGLSVFDLSAVFKCSFSCSLLISAGAVIVVSTLGAIRLRRLVVERSNIHVGWFGERLTAEFLDPLKTDGFHIFHDIPCEGAQKPFNLDHVVIGPTGVFVVETKTRRKLKGDKGNKNHEVVFDGQHLIWPWGRDRHGIEQAIAEAQWLRKFLGEKTGQILPVRPILALPGWFVREAQKPEIRVVNPSYIANVIRAQTFAPLSADVAKRLAVEIEKLGRDVAE